MKSQVPPQLNQFVFKKGSKGGPGRGKDKTLKEYSREYLAKMTEEERLKFLNSLDPDLVWRMAEGNPSNDLTSDGEQIQLIGVNINVRKRN